MLIAGAAGFERAAPLRIGARQSEVVEASGFPRSDMLATSGKFPLGQTAGNSNALAGLGDDTRYL